MSGSKSYYVARLRNRNTSAEEILNAVSFMLTLPCTMKEITICITAIRRTGHWEKACECLDYLKKRGMTPNVIIYSALIAACESGGQWKHAIGYLEEMKKMGIKPNVISYSSAISACEKAFQWSEALALLEDMKAEGIKPDVIAYNATISAMEKCHKTDEALRLLRRLLWEKVPVNTITYNATISACDKQKRWMEAVDVFQSMKLNNVPPDIITFNALISVCSRAGQVNVSLKLYLMMSEFDIQPDVITLTTLILVCIEKSLYKRAFEFYDLMLELGMDPSIKCKLAILSACEKCPPSGAKTLAYFDLVLGSNYSIKIIVYNTVLNTLLISGDYDYCLKVFFHLRKLIVPRPNSLTYTIVLNACAFLGYAELAIELINETKKKPNFVTPQMLDASIISCMTADKMDLAYSLYARIGVDLHITPTINTYNAFIERAILARDYEAVEFYKSEITRFSLQMTSTTNLLLAESGKQSTSTDDWKASIFEIAAL